jgi:hypothetical protein
MKFAACGKLGIQSGRNPEKAPAISGANWFTVRGGNRQLHAIFMTQIFIWGYQWGLSSKAVLDGQKSTAQAK